MANCDDSTAATTEIIPAGHAAFSPEDELGGRRSDTSTGLAGLSNAALGVVFGDIGTSPVYTFRECFNPEHGLPLDAEHVLGVLSMIFWALIIVVAVKYVVLIMRVDNQGEGGILALRGTGRVGRLFGPVMVLWFAVLALSGVLQIAESPRVLAALNPRMQSASLLPLPPSALSCSGPSRSPSPAARRSMPIWAILAGSRLSWYGSPWCFPLSSSIISDKAP
jgi:hypothetical protein